MSSHFNSHSLDEIVHGRGRLGILVYLSTVGEADFVAIREATKLTDGNLGSNIKKLEEAGLIATTRILDSGRTRTTALLTELGRDELDSYMEQMDVLLNQAKNAPRPEPQSFMKRLFG